MDTDTTNMKLIGSVVLGVIGGLLLGSYLWSGKSERTALSTHLETLAKVLKEIEGINTAEADDLRDRINHILNTIESNYGKAEE